MKPSKPRGLLRSGPACPVFSPPPRLPALLRQLHSISGLRCTRQSAQLCKSALPPQPSLAFKAPSAIMSAPSDTSAKPGPLGVKGFLGGLVGLKSQPKPIACPPHRQDSLPGKLGISCELHARFTPGCWTACASKCGLPAATRGRLQPPLRLCAPPRRAPNNPCPARHPRAQRSSRRRLRLASTRPRTSTAPRCARAVQIRTAAPTDTLCYDLYVRSKPRRRISQESLAGS